MLGRAKPKTEKLAFSPEFRLNRRHTQKIELDISHRQIQLRSCLFNESNVQWGKINVEQGVLAHPSHVVFDPIVDGSFLATVTLVKSDRFERNKDARRIICVPFVVQGIDELFISSVVTRHRVEIGVEKRTYSVFYEICESDDADEVFYRLTFVESKETVTPKYIMDDAFGGNENLVILLGKH